MIDNNTGSVSLRAVFDNKEGMRMSGATGNTLITSLQENCIVIPQSATVKLQDKYLVYKGVDGIAVSEQITVSSESDGKQYIVLSGIESGERIVSDGAGLVRAGMQINIEE